MVDLLPDLDHRVLGAWLAAAGGDLQATGGLPTWVWAALLMAAFAGLSVLTMVLARFPAQRAPPPVVPPTEAAGVEARRQLDAIRSVGLLDRGELTEYYGRIAACLRRYLAERFEVPADGLTPAELEVRLGPLEMDRRPVELAAAVLRRCEAVLSGGGELAHERAESDLAAAYEVVALTSRSESEARPDSGAVGPS